MNYKNIAEILNSQVVQNALGVQVTIAEDLSNLVELGTRVADLTSDALKTFQRALVVGVHNYVIADLYEKGRRFRMLKNAEEFGGGLQRIMASGLYTAQDSHLLNLVNGQAYLDGKYYGLPLDSKVYVDTKAFKVVHSISEDNFSQMVMDSEQLANLMGLIAVTERNTIEIEMTSLSNRILNMLITQSYDGNRRVRLLTSFNAENGTSLTLQQIKADRLLMSYFSDYCKDVVAQLVDYVQYMNNKYNDTTVVTHSPKSRINIELLTKFAMDIKYLGNPVDLQQVDFPYYETIPAWQNAGKEMLPPISTAGEIKINAGTTEAPEVKTYSNIVGCIYDTECTGITIKADKVTIEPVGSEGFINYHHHLAHNFYCDTRLGAVVLTLD